MQWRSPVLCWWRVAGWVLFKGQLEGTGLLKIGAVYANHKLQNQTQLQCFFIDMPGLQTMLFTKPYAFQAGESCPIMMIA
jgi:hypothetical protein